MTPAIRVVIVDDHPVVRDGLRGMLANDAGIEVIGEAGDGAAGVEVVARLAPDVVLMDLRMPDVDGVTATARIVAASPTVRVLVLTTFDTEADILRAVEAGAAGYLLKDTPRDELGAAIRATARGEAVLAPRVAARLVRQVRGPASDALTPREVEVLELVARGATNREVAGALHISEATVKSHLLHIFTKLGVDDRTAAVTAALGRGVIRL